MLLFSLNILHENRTKKKSEYVYECDAGVHKFGKYLSATSKF